MQGDTDLGWVLNKEKINAKSVKSFLILFWSGKQWLNTADVQPQTFGSLTTWFDYDLQRLYWNKVEEYTSIHAFIICYFLRCFKPHAYVLVKLLSVFIARKKVFWQKLSFKFNQTFTSISIIIYHSTRCLYITQAFNKDLSITWSATFCLRMVDWEGWAKQLRKWKNIKWHSSWTILQVKLKLPNDLSQGMTRVSSWGIIR